MFLRKKTEKTVVDNTINKSYLYLKDNLNKDFDKVDRSERKSGKYGDYKEIKAYQLGLIQYALINSGHEESSYIKNYMSCKNVSWNTLKSLFQYNENGYIDYFPENIQPLIEI